MAAPATVPTRELRDLASNLRGRARIMEQAGMCMNCAVGGTPQAFREVAADLDAMAEGKDWKKRPERMDA